MTDITQPVVGLSPDLLRPRDLPPDGFVALAAEPRELDLYGLPRRPDESTHAPQAALWDALAAGSWTFVRPTLVPGADRATSTIRDHQVVEPPDRARPDAARPQLHQPACWLFPDTSSNWSGAAVSRPDSEPLLSVTGEWTVPAVSPPASARTGAGYRDGRYVCSVWVGLDGRLGTNDVLQAGTSSEVVVSDGKVTTRTTYAWVEWFGKPWDVVDGFEVSPGDSVFCVVCAPSGGDLGRTILVNRRTGLTTNLPIDAPSGVALSGNVAEWIVEDPADLSGALMPFPDYGRTTFRNCSAGSRNHSLHLVDACPIDLTDGAGSVVSRATMSEEEVICEFAG